jgi:hypothetical protein
MNCDIFVFVSTFFLGVTIPVRLILDYILPTGHKVNPNNPNRFDRIRQGILNGFTGVLLFIGISFGIAAINCFFDLSALTM